MVDTANDPLGIESMIKTWTKSMNELMASQEKQGDISQMLSTFFTQPFQSPFNSNAFESPFNIMFKQPFSSDFSGESYKNQFNWASFLSNNNLGGDSSDNTTKKRKDVMAAMANAMKNWLTMTNAMTSPEFTSALFKGAGTMPEMLTNIAQSTISGMTEIHQKMAESVIRMSQSVQAYNFDDIDENIFQAWADIYEKEFRKFLRVPQLGLNREYQEKINDMVDKLNIAQTTMSEFMRLLYLPFQRSAFVMQEEIDKIVEKGELSEDPQFYYQMWLKILEGHFMTLFQTPEYVETLGKTVESMSQFTNAREKVVEDMLKSLPIASRSEIDDVAKELHQLKKEIRYLKKNLGGKI
ncbi:MAG: hypothetical protein HQK63_12475 [Desulfamplus sp.]|nr:hypothetical protein [Desulfamplus sp.]